MPVSAQEVREIARRFLSVFGYTPSDQSDQTIVEWHVLLKTKLTEQSVTDKNWCRRLTIVIARTYLEDDDVYIDPFSWNDHIDSLDDGNGNQRETRGELITFLRDVL